MCLAPESAHSRYNRKDFSFLIVRSFVRIADKNEAAGAADAARGGSLRHAAATESSVGSQGGPCDPTSQNDAGGTPAS